MFDAAAQLFKERKKYFNDAKEKFIFDSILLLFFSNQKIILLLKVSKVSESFFSLKVDIKEIKCACVSA